jgi:hypothetical protein
MVRKSILSVAAILVAASLVWAGNDPWKSKSYQQWDDKDIRKIFNDSPWAKVVQVSTSSSMPSGGVPAEPSTSNPGQGNRSMMGGQASQPSIPSDNQQAQTTQATQTPFVVRWVSSRTIREAAVRDAMLKGQLKQDEATKELSQPVDTYQVLIAGPDMKAFQAVDEARLKGSTLFQTKRTKEKLEPTEVKIERGPDGKSIQSIVFSFAKKTANGEPTIAPDEKGADFSTSAGGLKISTSFDFTKMEDSQGRDL